jgi:SAM-dependent methyltransferase
MDSQDSQILAWINGNYFIDSPYTLTPQQSQSLIRKNNIFQSFVIEFSDDVGIELSKKERKARNFTDSSLTYGEIDFASLAEIFYTIESRFRPLSTCKIFYDLGSGTGKGVLAAALLSSFDVCIGIEILESLFNASLEIKSKYEEQFKRVQAENNDLFGSMPRVEFMNTDFFNADWSDADIIYCSTTCFTKEMKERIGNLPLKPGTIMISLTYAIRGKNWIVLESVEKSMSWGETVVYIQRYVSTEDINRLS